MKKVFDQTVRDLKREVNKKVLKVPGIEQKVLDATSNEPWGPHGTLLADIAQATRTYHEYQMIMPIIWKRISDTGKNWRHVYKGLTVLEYLVAHGSERVIEDIREHTYQISALADFQYLDSSGRDQGNNVRRKSQSLVALVSDKERIVEVRQKAAANREKFRTSSTSGMYRPGSYGDRYDNIRYEDRYSSRDDDRSGYGREREWASRDDDRYGRNGDSYCRDGDRYGRDGYKDDDYRENSPNTNEYQRGSRSRSSERDLDHAYDDDGQHSSQGSGARVDDQFQNGRVHEQKFPEQNTGAPPSYEEAVTESRSPVHSERDGEPASSSAARASPHVSNNSSTEATTFKSDASSAKQEVDEFDPRGSVVAPISAPPTTSSNAEMDLLGSLSDSFSANVLAIMPAPSATASSETGAHANFGLGPTSSLNVTNQAFDDPFGDTPFKANPSADSGVPQPQPSTSIAQFQPTMNQNAEHPLAGTPNGEAATNFGFEDSFSATTYPSSGSLGVQPPSNSLFSPPKSSSPHHDIDILADILPLVPQPPAPSQAPSSSSSDHPAQPNASYYGGFQSQAGSAAPVAPNMYPHTQTEVVQAPQTQNLGQSTQYPTGSAAPFSSGYLHQQPGSAVGSQSALETMSGPLTQMATQPTGPTSIVAQPSKEKFETKSTVWADTLSRGLVDLNISGSKTNPLADIGVDFASINRREKRMEKPAATPVTSTVTMGKAMGSGSGMGRAGVSALRPASNPMMGSGMSMGRGYGGMSQPMGMNMRIGQGAPMQPSNVLPPGSTMSAGYNPMMGTGGYASQQPYGGYR